MEMGSAVTILVTEKQPGTCPGPLARSSYKPVPPSVYCPDLPKQGMGKKNRFFINAPALSFFFPFMTVANSLVPPSLYLKV